MEGHLFVEGPDFLIVIYLISSVMTTPLVSVAIASYNNAKYITRCIDSVIKQSYTNLEILIVDDGSSDNTADLLTHYNSENRIEVIYKNNEGLSTVRQKALDLAKGEFICFIDADDYLFDSYVEIMLNKISATCSDICVCGTRFEDDKGNYLSSYTKMFECRDSSKSYQPTYPEINQYNYQQIGDLHISDSWNKMYNVKYLHNCHVKFCMPKGLNGTDELFNRVLLLHRPRYVTVSKELYVHVMYQKSAVHRKAKNLIASYAIILDKMVEECIKLGVEKDLERFLTYYYIESLYSAHLDVWNDGDNNFTTINEVDRELRRKHGFLSNIRGLKMPVNLVSFYFIYNHINRLLPLFFGARSSLSFFR